jgi:membrane protein DedA with SNARE-associated domain/membrane-associated phospholipid phosphatase
MHIIDRIIHLPLAVLSHWGYWIIFLFAFIETSPFFGLFIPGQSVLIVGGFLAKIGILKLTELIFIATLGTLIGDFTGYLLGRRYGFSLFSKYGKYVLLKKEHLDNTKKLVNKHTGKALILGRFNSVTRAVAPFAAGSMDIPFSKFVPFNILSCIMYSMAFIFIGYILGTSYEIASHYMGKIFFAAFILSIISVYAYHFINKRKQLFARYHLHILILNVISLIIFSRMLDNVVDSDLITGWDIWLNGKMVSLWNPLLNKVMIFISYCGSAPFLITLSVILFAVLIYKRRRYHSLLLATALAAGLISELIIKSVVLRARPNNSMVHISGYSFPSAHTTMATIFFSLLMYSFKDDIKNKLLKILFIAATTALFILIGFSRVYLNVHWFSDVIAGVALGLFWLTLLILLFKYAAHLQRRVEPIPQ